MFKGLEIDRICIYYDKQLVQRQTARDNPLNKKSAIWKLLIGILYNEW